MAIANIKAYSHLTDADIEEIGRRLDAIKADVESTLGERDVRYIKSMIRTQRILELSGRATLLLSHRKPAFWAGTGMLALAKILENMEIGHNVIHGQWDWMNDPTIHSTTWEWDMNCPSKQWMHTHNHVHHTYTNILGMDHDVGYGVLRVTRDRKWAPQHAFQPVTNAVLASFFQWAIAFYDVELGRLFAGKQTWEETAPKFWETVAKVRNQVLKDYLLYPLLTGPNFKHTVRANLIANLVRNWWSYAVIFCGHFPDEAETFTKEQWENETKGEWYLRQMLGSANFKGGAALTILSGNLNYQIEHHLFPDMPSNRLAAVGKQVQALAEEFDLPYHTGSFPAQFGKVQRTLLKLSLPNSFLAASPDNAPEVRSNQAFTPDIEANLQVGADEAGRRRGLKPGLQLLAKARPSAKEALRYALMRPVRRQSRVHKAEVNGTIG
ncbi:fatty acid desaturase family protein [Corynebacterium epidermidicanis]|uniref:Fatty acid desaturase n=1 Tax=Corynebacterium epidermidicanis TaxID=1050174 RepID=A0A0G3GUI3_9CORY|nr:acyl-CoA desaturase [Corynebacterium epidermidicanis]AKK02542.1 fatty acid desaturase [Corynebacterium epidermidicanis]